MSERFLRDNAADRALGALWEANFCRLACWYNKSFHAYQDKREGAARWGHGSTPQLLPDVQIFTDGGEYHELKHKNPTNPKKLSDRCYGLEAYRLKHLVALQHDVNAQPVFYTIHDWEVAEARASDRPMRNLVQDWRVARVQMLDVQKNRPEFMQTWISGTATGCQGYYWPITLWDRLDLYWGLPR